MTDDELCEKMGIERKRPGYPEATITAKVEPVYPTGDALTKALKAALIEKGYSFDTSWDDFHKHWYVGFLCKGDKRPVINDDNWEITAADTELDAIKAACKAMCELNSDRKGVRDNG